MVMNFCASCMRWLLWWVYFEYQWPHIYLAMLECKTIIGIRGVNKIKSSKVTKCEVKGLCFFNMIIRSIASFSPGCKPVPYDSSSFVSTFASVIL